MSIKFIGYHVTDNETAKLLAINPDTFNASTNDYDWLGSGVYFWGFNPSMCDVWVKRKFRNSNLDNYSVIKVEINPVNMLDLTNREDLNLLRISSNDLISRRNKDTNPKEIPFNINFDTNDPQNHDKFDLRNFDCLAINDFIIEQNKCGLDYDAVFGVFEVGQPITKNLSFRRFNNSQICIRVPYAKNLINVLDVKPLV